MTTNEYKVQEEFKDILFEIAPYIKWDPSTEEYEEFDQTKIRHVFKRYFQSTEWDTKFTDAGGDTLYKVLKNHPLCNLVHLMQGEVTPEQMVESTKEGLIEGLNRFPIILTDGEKFVETQQQFAREVQDLKNSGVLDFDMSSVKLELPDSGTTTAVNALLQTTSLPPLQQMVSGLREGDNKVKEEIKRTRDALNQVEGLEDNIKSLQAELVKANTTMSFETVKVEANEDLGVPEGEVEFKSASEVFGIELDTDFNVPVWNWEHAHPDVPKEDENYIFRSKELMRVLYSIIKNRRIYLHGHTGSGKTTLIEQVCAHLKYPFIRVNFDSEVTRMDLIGRDTLTTDEEGNTISSFVDGILPRAMSSPTILCCDEIDFVRPDVAYVMQAALEGNGLRITEDGDRHVVPHPMFRMVATGNTVGQGDEHGMYQGARAQSLALLDRFTVWLQVNYLDKKQRSDLVKHHFPALSLDNQAALGKYVEEHIEAFLAGKVLQPISPRGMLAIAEAALVFGNLKDALEMTVLDRSSHDDRAVLAGIIDRVA